MTHILSAAFWAFLLGFTLGTLSRYLWDNRARIMEALRG